MYVAPRPREDDDPLFPIRLASGAVVGFILAVLLQSPVPALPPVLIVALMAGMRKAFDPKKALVGPIGVVAMVIVLASVTDLAGAMPMFLIVLAGALCVLSYYIILSTGNPAGMMIAVMTVMMMVMRLSSPAAIDFIRDGLIEAALCALFAIPVLYLLFPPRAKEPMVEVYQPAREGHHGLRALIRGCVLLLLSFWLITFLDSSDLMLAVAAVFVLVFPTREQLVAEAWERTFATVIGAVMASAILIIASVTAHFIVLLILVMLTGLLFGYKMMHGLHSHVVYQFGFTVTISLVAGALSTQEPVGAMTLRISLTLAGAVSAAFLTALLERLLIRSEAHEGPIVPKP